MQNHRKRAAERRTERERDKPHDMLQTLYVLVSCLLAAIGLYAVLTYSATVRKNIHEDYGKEKSRNEDSGDHAP